MNRVGDVGLALAIFLIWRSLGTVRFSDCIPRAGEIGGPTLLAITLLLLLGACGKSGQFPAGLVARRDGGPDPGQR